MARKDRRKYRVGAVYGFYELMEDLYNMKTVMYKAPGKDTWKPMHPGYTYSWQFRFFKVMAGQGRFARAVRCDG